MNRYRLAQLFILVAALNVSGCGGPVDKATTDVKAAGASPTANAASPTPASVAATVPAGTVPAPTATAGGSAPSPSTPPASAARGAGSAPPTKMPTPQIGSGGNDFFLFTQARAAVNADPELRAANLVIEVKDGVVTLNGTVASAALKAKAEELASGVKPKSIRNQLRVSAGK
ncbi:MAG TPA: BON domain-containing protein [Pyrinomonadaceae bacterium]